MTPEQRKRAEELLELMGEEPKPKSNWTLLVPIAIAFCLIAIYIAIMLFAPDWAKFLATGWVIGRIVWVNRDKLLSLFKK